MKHEIPTTQVRATTAGKKFLALGLLAFIAFATQPAGAITVTLYPVPGGGGGPISITAGPDGNLWYTRDIVPTGRIGKITTGGVVTEYSIPTPNSGPFGITAGPDGNLWFTEYAGQIGKVTTSGAFTEYPLPTLTCSNNNSTPCAVDADCGAGNTCGNFHLPPGITTGPDGNLWFTEFNQIGRITTGGSITEYPTNIAGSAGLGITAGLDGRLWFTQNNANLVGRIDTSGGVFPDFIVPTANSQPADITVGPDGNMWFTEFDGNKIGRIKAGVITEYAVPTANSKPDGITAGPDGNLWFTEYGANQIGLITTGGTITEYPTAGTTLRDIALGPDGNLWFTAYGSNQIGKVMLSTATPPGPGVMVSLSTTIFNTKNNTNTSVVVDVTFANVTIAGITTVTATSTPTDLPLASLTADVGLCSKTKSLGCQTDGDCPSGQTCKGYHGFAFDISTTASVSGPFTVCQHYEDNEHRPTGGNGRVDGTGKPGLLETSLRMLHEENGVFVDVTSPGYPDTLHNVVCGEVNSLASSAAATSGRAGGTAQGAFGLYVRTDMPGGGDLTNDCWSEWAKCESGSSGGGNVKLPKLKRGALAPTVDAAMTCSSGNPKCKTTLNGAAACNFCVRLCANVSDGRFSCSPVDVKEFQLTTPTEQGQDNDSLNAGRIIDGLKGLSTGPPAVISGPHGATITLNPATSAPRACSGPMNIVIPVNGVAKKVKLLAASSNGQADIDTLTLACPK